MFTFSLPFALPFAASHARREKKRRRAKNGRSDEWHERSRPAKRYNFSIYTRAWSRVYARSHCRRVEDTRMCVCVGVCVCKSRYASVVALANAICAKRECMCPSFREIDARESGVSLFGNSENVIWRVYSFRHLSTRAPFLGSSPLFFPFFLNPKYSSVFRKRYAYVCACI